MIIKNKIPYYIFSVLLFLFCFNQKLNAEPAENRTIIVGANSGPVSTSSQGGGEFAMLGFDYMQNGYSYLRLNVGAKVYANGSEIFFAQKFITFPVEAIYFAKLNKLEFGAGAMMHLFPVYREYTLGFRTADISYETGLGYLIQLNYVISFNKLGLRYEKISYGGVNADSISLIMERRM